MVRVLICWPTMVGYMVACFRALGACRGIDLLVVAGSPASDGSYRPDRHCFSGVKVRLLSPEERNAETVTQIATAFDPHVVSLPGWGTPYYRRLAFEPSLQGAAFLMVMDTPRRDTWRQRLGKYRFRRYFSRMSKVSTAGERAFQCARLVGFKELQISRGAAYGIDYESFSRSFAARQSEPGGWPKRFLFTGRYHSAKAIDMLLEAYTRYRQSVGSPWPLTTCGSGQLEAALSSTPGVENLGFVQPTDQSSVYAQHGVFVLASRFDPWPLVIVEACAAGLPVVCTEACGSAVELVRCYYNGLTVPTEDPRALAKALRYMHDHYDELPEMGRRGMALAAPFAADVWARRWVEMIDEVCLGRRGELSNPISAPLAS